MKAAAICGLALGVAGCDAVDPEVAVVNATAPHILVRDPSYGGCLWSTVLAYGEATTSQRCLPGEDRVHFKKLDVTQAAASPDTAPTWFNYQTSAEETADYGGFYLLTVTLDMEQDFSIPGPYGH